MTTLYEKFIMNPQRNVKYNDKEQENKFGFETIDQNGYYKNGYTASSPKPGKNGKHNYITIKVYTVAKSMVDIEEIYMLRDDDKVVERKGWTCPPNFTKRVDLFKLEPQQVHYKDLTHLYNLT
tara:strand:- start:252 stop:620 length:369 start_codon:yes stop_codon:yes gene_type:complete